jgi:hypothetical protein
LSISLLYFVETLFETNKTKFIVSSLNLKLIWSFHQNSSPWKNVEIRQIRSIVMNIFLVWHFKDVGISYWMSLFPQKSRWNQQRCSIFIVWLRPIYAIFKILSYSDIFLKGLMRLVLPFRSFQKASFSRTCAKKVKEHY